MLSLSTTPIRDIMIKDVITIDQGISLSKAAEKMLHYRVGCLIVMDGLKPVGIVTERDFVNIVKTGRRFYCNLMNVTNEVFELFRNCKSKLIINGY